MNCQRMVTRVGEKVENRSGGTWTATKVLEAIDEAVQSLIITQQEAYKDYELDYTDLNVAIETTAGRMVNTGQNLLEWRVPEFMHKIRRIEDTTSSDTPVTIPAVDLQRKELMRDIRFKAGGHHWLYTRRSTVFSQVGFVGMLEGVSTIRVWYIRRVAPLHYGTAQLAPATTVNVNSASGQVVLNVASTTGFAAGMRVRIAEGIAARDETREILTVTSATQLTLTANLGFTHLAVDADTVEAVNVLRFAGTPAAGRIVRRDDAYVGAVLELTSNSPAGVIDQMAVVDDYISSQQDAVVDDDWRSVLTTATTYAMVPQIEPEHHELVVIWASMRLAEETGSQKMMNTLGPKLDKLMNDFVNAIEHRQHQTPQFVFHAEAENEI